VYVVSASGWQAGAHVVARFMDVDVVVVLAFGWCSPLVHGHISSGIRVCMGVRVWARIWVVFVVAFGVAIVDMGVHSCGQRRGGACRQGPAEGACGTARRRARGSVP
jgi:hypothetical protein